ncbi:cytochrome P450 [Calidifontibacter terrae]
MTDALALGFRVDDPNFIADPYPVLADLRAAGRVIPFADRDVWLLPHFADVNAALRNRSLGRSFEHRYTPEEFGRPGLADLEQSFPRFVESERWSLLNLEPPDHTRIRRLVTKVFTAKAIREFQPQIDRIAASALQQVSATEGFDVIGDLAQPYSIRVICELLGAPDDRAQDLLDWSHAIVKMYEVSTSDAQRDEAERAAGQFVDFVSELIEARRQAPGDDLISELVQVADEGERLSVHEIVCTVIVLLNAGHEATVNTMGNGVAALLNNPGQWQRLVDGGVRPDIAVEEMLRFDPPLQMFERWVLEPVELGGRQFQPGERVAMLFGAANRDPERFVDADSFVVDRGDSTHIGFGGGVHFCIGAPLARAELATLLGGLVAKYPHLRLASAPQRQNTFVIRGYHGVDVTTASRT